MLANFLNAIRVGKLFYLLTPAYGWRHKLEAFHKHTTFGLCIKLGRGQGDGGIGTLVWGLRDARRGTWGHQVWDAGTCGTGTRDVKYRDAGDTET